MFDGNGNWISNFSAVADRNADIKILASRFDNIFIADIAESFEDCLTKDMQVKPTQNFDANNFRVIDVADPVADNDAVNLQTLNARIAAVEQDPILAFKWSDYEINDQSWLRADTFSWNDGTVYTNAYTHLYNDIQDVTSSTETIGSYTITYYKAEDGHKIVMADQETTVQNIYNESGVAWYYIIDTTNQRFKLPRENPNKEILATSAPVVGTGIALGLRTEDGSNAVSNSFGMLYNPNSSIALDVGNAASGTSAGTAVTTGGARNKIMSVGVSTSETNSGLVAKLSSEIGIYKGKQYLYFYVGQFSQSATEQTAGLNSSLFNGKVDLDGNNATFAHIVDKYSNGTSWYRKWSDGWIEQGGRVTTGAWAGSESLLVPYNDMNFSVFITVSRNNFGGTADGYNYFGTAEPGSNYGFNWATVGHAGTQAFHPFQWYACGYKV